MANNIRLLSSGPRCGFYEIKLPDLQPGSSIMPGKVNPVLCESVMQVAARVMGNDQTISLCGSSGGQFQLNVMMPIMADAALESVRLMSSAAAGVYHTVPGRHGGKCRGLPGGRGKQPIAGNRIDSIHRLRTCGRLGQRGLQNRAKQSANSVLKSKFCPKISSTKPSIPGA